MTAAPTTSLTVTSADGTRIACTCRGGGPAVVLVDGAFDRRSFSPNTPLAPLLADRFAVFTYDRRGRGESGDTQPYAVRREVEDLAAVVQAAAGSAYVYRLSPAPPSRSRQRQRVQRSCEPRLARSPEMAISR